MSGTLNVTGTINTMSGTNQIQLPQEVIANPVNTVQNIALANGTNTIAVPAGTTAVIIQPPVGNLTPITLKGVAGDTGIPLHLTLATGPINLASGVASFVLTAGAAIANFTVITFI